MEKITPKSRLQSVAFALSGLRALVQTQPNARIHLVATISVVSLGFALGLSGWEWSMIVLAIGIVWLAEALNTGFEFVCDVVSPGWNEKVKAAKDIAAAGVLMASISAASVGLIVFVPHISAVLS